MLLVGSQDLTGPLGPGPCDSRAVRQLAWACVVAWLLKRRIHSLEARVASAREELAILDEQQQVLTEMAEEARITSLVEESPIASHELAEARRHADAVARSIEVLREQVSHLERAGETARERARRKDRGGP